MVWRKGGTTDAAAIGRVWGDSRDYSIYLYEKFLKNLIIKTDMKAQVDKKGIRSGTREGNGKICQITLYI